MKPETKILKIINKAIPLALLDREHYLECLVDNDDKEEVIKEIKDIKSQCGLKIKDLDANIVNLILLYAEQQEQGYAFSIESVKDLKDSYNKSVLESKCFRELRHSIFGKTKLEQFCDSAKPVNVFDIKGEYE